MYGSGRGGVAGLTGTVPRAPRLVAPEWLPAAKSRSGILGWVAATDIAISLLLMIFVCVAGPSLVVPVIPRTWPIPPLWLPLHLSQATSVTLIYFAIVLGGVGVACGLEIGRASCRERVLVAV